LKCIVCKKRRRSGGTPECWTYRKCNKCYHNDQKEFPILKDTSPLRVSTYPTDIFLDKGMAYELRSMQKNEN
jgi:hypothetical protein